MNLTEPPVRKAAPAPRPELKIPLRSRTVLPRERPRLSVELGFALQHRRTTYGSKRLDLSQLGHLLEMACAAMPDAGGRRPWPSAGGLYPIEVLCQDVDVLEDGLFRYDAVEHALDELDCSPEAVIQLRQLAAPCLPCPPGTLIWLVACEAVTASRYENPESLVWRDAGTLIQTLQLTAFGLGYAVAPLGVTGQPELSRLAWSTPALGVGGLSLAQLPPAR